jgi:hypothetical protein
LRDAVRVFPWARDTSWMLTTDLCGGFRPVEGTRLACAVSLIDRWDRERVYEVPYGWRWATTAEVLAEAPRSVSRTALYGEAAGWTAPAPGPGFFFSLGPAFAPLLEWEGVRRCCFVCADSAVTRRSQGVSHVLRFMAMDGGLKLAGVPLTEAQFAGVMCVLD